MYVCKYHCIRYARLLDKSKKSVLVNIMKAFHSALV